MIRRCSEFPGAPSVGVQVGIGASWGLTNVTSLYRPLNNLRTRSIRAPRPQRRLRLPRRNRATHNFGRAPSFRLVLSESAAPSWVHATLCGVGLRQAYSVRVHALINPPQLGAAPRAACRAVGRGETRWWSVVAVLRPAQTLVAAARRFSNLSSRQPPTRLPNVICDHLPPR